MNYFFTADEHFGHANIIKYCNRPFKNTDEMDSVIIERHNEVVKEDDIVVHAGDFTMNKYELFIQYFTRLNGSHIFIKGSHDKWMKEIKKSSNEWIKEDIFLNDKPLNNNYHEIWEKKINGERIIVCHYAMRTWPNSHYNSWQLFGHSHGRLEAIGKQLDIGVDTNNFYPYSFEQIEKIMEKKEDNFNKIK